MEHKQVDLLVEQRGFYMTNVAQADKSVLSKKKKLACYLFIKNRLLLKLPISLVLFIIHQSAK